MIEFAYAASRHGACRCRRHDFHVIMIVVMMAIFYFLLIRPENKRKKQAEEMRSSLQEGRLADHHRRRVWPYRGHHRPHRGHRDQRGPGPHGVREVRHRLRGYAG